jgi:secondary thiamine-phosphate synthase enzyme
MHTLQLKTSRRTQLLDITDKVAALVQTSEVLSGVCHLYVPHTTAAITINEHADPDVAADVEAALDRLIPHRGPYAHTEGNSDSHIKAILVGNSQTVFIENARLVLGRWQGIFFAEFDGPRERHLHIKVVADPQ